MAHRWAKYNVGNTDSIVSEKQHRLYKLLINKCIANSQYSPQHEDGVENMGPGLVTLGKRN